MTDAPQPPRDSLPADERDELASAHLDGATTREDAARVASDPQLAGRVERFAMVRDALRATPDQPVDLARRDAAIAAALDAFADGPAPATGAEGTADAVALVRPTRHLPRRRTLQLIGAAAAVVLLAVAVPLLGRLGSDRRDDTASSSFDATGSSLATPPEAAAEAGGTGDDGEAGGLGAFDAASPTDLGAFADLASLRATVRDQVQKSAASTTAAPTIAADDQSERTTCSPEPFATVVYLARAHLDDQPVTVLVREDAEGARTLVVLDAACAVVSEEPL